MKRYTEWYTFGWHGITVRLPSEWNLGRIGGDVRTGVSGYLRLDDAEMSRVEIEWRADPESKRATSGSCAAGDAPTSKRRQGSDVNVKKVVDAYLAVLQKKAKAKGTSFSVQRDLPLAQIADEHECFIWEADLRAYNVARICSVCGRVVMLRVLAKLSESGDAFVSSIFESLQDHPDRDSRHNWGIYDLTFSVPSELTLEDYSLQSGHLAFRFQERTGRKEAGGTGARLRARWGRPGRRTYEIDRFSLGSLLLKRHSSLPEWFDLHFRKTLRDAVVAYQPSEFGGHSGYVLTGRPKSGWRRLLVPLPFVSRRSRRYLAGRLWHCPYSDKILSIKAVTTHEEPFADEVVTIVCHQESAEHLQGGDAAVSPE